MALPLSYIEISQANLQHNIRSIKKLLPNGVKVAASIKANAYGHGQNEVAKILNKEVDYFQVNSIEELRELRKVTKKSVLLLGYVAKEHISEAIDLGCEMAVFSLQHIVHIDKVARRRNKLVKVHIAIDSSLGREGILPQETAVFLHSVSKLKNVKPVGVYAHFANIEDAVNLKHALKQIDGYEKALEQFDKFGYKKLQRHISATSGVMALGKGGAYDLVRVGVGLYGMWPSHNLKKEHSRKFVLKPVMRWVTHVSLVKWLPKGHTIGYGLTYKTSKETKIALIPQGYADGYDRGFSNKGEVLIKGKRCKVLGRVSMNVFVVDVTHLKDVKVEDEVVLLGRQGGEEITAEEIGDMISTINYEITTRVSPLLTRVIK